LVRLAVWTAFIGVALDCLWLVMSALHDVVGLRAFGYGVAFAAIPAPFLIAGFMLFERRRPEPLQLMIVAIIWGVCIASWIALKGNSFVLDRLEPTEKVGIRGAVFVAPWVEEAAKALLVFGIVWWRRRRIVSPVGAAIYGALVGVGFAFTENVVYYSGVFQSTIAAHGDEGLALDAVQRLFWWRGVAAPFVHPVFTLTTGLAVGLAMRQRHLGARLLMPVAGYLGAVLLHTGYNALASFATERALAALYVGILVPLLLAALAALLFIRRHERRVIAARIDDYVSAGWLRPWQSEAVGTRVGRRRVLQGAARHGPFAKHQARAWLAAGAELGAVRDRVIRGLASDADLRAERRLLDAVRGVTVEHRAAAVREPLPVADAAAGSATS
jgi:RsiW-degrading membrane proteinase PrsW (M82 family)